MRQIQGQDPARVGLRLVHFLVVDFHVIVPPRRQAHHKDRLLFLQSQLELPRLGTEDDRGLLERNRRHHQLRVQCRQAPLRKHLHGTVKVTEPFRIVVPIRPHEQPAGIRVVVNQRHVVVTQPRLIRIGPQKLIGRAEGAFQHELVVHQPTLQHLAFRRVHIECHHGHLGGAGKRRQLQVRIAGAARQPDAVLVFRGRIQRRIVAHQVLDRKVLEEPGRGLAQIQVGAVPDRMQHLPERKRVVARNRAAAVLERGHDFPAPPVPDHALQLPLRRLWNMIEQRHCRQYPRPHQRHAFVGRPSGGNSPLQAGGQIAPLRLRHQVLAPVEYQRLLAQIRTGAQSPRDGTPPGFRVPGDPVVERLGKAALRHGRLPRDQRFELYPALRRPLALPFEQPQPLGSQEQSGMLGGDHDRLIGLCGKVWQPARQKQAGGPDSLHSLRLCHSDTRLAHPSPKPPLRSG